MHFVFIAFFILGSKSSVIRTTLRVKEFWFDESELFQDEEQSFLIDATLNINGYYYYFQQYCLQYQGDGPLLVPYQPPLVVDIQTHSTLQDLYSSRAFTFIVEGWEDDVGSGCQYEAGDENYAYRTTSVNQFLYGYSYSRTLSHPSSAWYITLDFKTEIISTPNPTAYPTPPTPFPTPSPSKFPSRSPSASPSRSPSQFPSKSPTKYPTKGPTASPTADPTSSPTLSPIATSFPTFAPSLAPPSALPITSPTPSVVIVATEITKNEQKGDDANNISSEFFIIMGVLIFCCLCITLAITLRVVKKRKRRKLIRRASATEMQTKKHSAGSSSRQTSSRPRKRSSSDLASYNQQLARPPRPSTPTFAAYDNIPSSASTAKKRDRRIEWPGAETAVYTAPLNYNTVNLDNVQDDSKKENYIDWDVISGRGLAFPYRGGSGNHSYNTVVSLPADRGRHRSESGSGTRSRRKRTSGEEIDW